MSRYFIPYSGDKPTAVDINGHRLIILCKDRGAIEDDLEIIGADSLKLMKTGGSREEESRALNRLSKTNHAGVVIAPDDIELKDVLKNLEVQLPWLQ